MKRVVLINQASRGGRRHPLVLRRWLQRHPDLVLWVTSSAADLSARLQQEPLDSGDLLIVYGGDGTVQNLLTELSHLPVVPTLALLPGGSTNMSANGVNRHRRLPVILKALESTNLCRQTVPVLQVKDGASQQAGFFFGVGQIVNGVEYTNSHLFRHNELRHEATSGLALLRIVWGVLRQDPEYLECGPLAMKAVPMVANLQTPDFDAPQPALLLMATTLRRLLFGFVPYWNSNDTQPLKLTWVADRAQSLWRTLPGLLGLPGFRAPARRPQGQQGYHSFGAQQIQLKIDQPYTLDGEIFKAPDKPLSLAISNRFRFLVL